MYKSYVTTEMMFLELLIIVRQAHLIGGHDDKFIFCNI